MSECACGPDWMPRKFTHWYLGVPKGEKCFFHAACVEHDIDYEHGILSREDCDFKFLISTLKLAVENKASHKQVFRATGFFRKVRWFGWVSYYYWRYKQCHRWV